MNKKPKKNNRKVYRLAVYGLSQSGKTCMLTALAMPRYSHPLGYTCTWQPIDVESVDYGEIKQLLAHEEMRDEQIKQLLAHSNDEMGKVKQILSEGQPPKANAISDGHFLFKYEFTGKTHQTFHVELTDYSGELNNPNNAHDDDAKKLRQKLSRMDGILVLAEASVESEQKNLYKELSDLQQTFSLLRAERQTGAALDMPVALLINKWDRYSEIDYAHPENEQQKLEELVNAPQSPHRTVYNDLKSSITEGNFQIFPVSALGPNEFVQLENGERVERPKQINPLNTFGLEDPFIWLVERHNAIDLRNYLDKGIKNKACGKTGQELLNRFPPKSEETKQIKQVMWQCRRAAIKRVIVGAAIIVTLVFGGETTWDAVKYRQFTVTVDNPQATNEELDDAQKWLTQYIAAPHFRHRLSQLLFLDREEAQTRLAKLQAYREKFLWQAVETARKENLQAALKPAKEYLQYYPYGAHAQEARNLILRAEIQQQQQANEDALRKIEGVAQANWQDADSLNELLEQLRHVPHPEAETDTLRDKRVALDKRISERVVDLFKQGNEKKFRRSYERTMRAGNFLEAARLLSNSAQDQTLLNELKGKFKKDAILEIERRVKKALQDDRFEPANELLRMYENFPPQLQTHQGRQQMKTLQAQVAARQDQVLYEVFRRYPERDRIERYLNEAPLQTMRTEVLKYKAYLEKIDPKATLTGLKVELQSIYWQGGAYEGSNNVVRLFKDGQLFLIKKKLKSKANTTNRINKDSWSPFNAKPFERITITVTIVEKCVWEWGDEDNGQVSVTKQVSELAAKGYGLQLRRNKDNVKTAQVYVKISGYPEAPTLPTWHKKR